jgi:hypothetical protein
VKDYYGIYAVFSDDRGGGYLKTYVCALPDLGNVLNDIYREDVTEVSIAGSGSDEFVVHSQLLVAVAEEIAFRRSYGTTTRTPGSVRSIFLEYDESVSFDEEYMVVGQDLDEIVGYTMRAILCGATNMMTVYRGNNVDAAVTEVTRYILKAHNFLQDDEVSSDVG